MALSRYLIGGSTSIVTLLHRLGKVRLLTSSLTLFNALLAIPAQLMLLKTSMRFVSLFWASKSYWTLIFVFQSFLRNKNVLVSLILMCYGFSVLHWTLNELIGRKLNGNQQVVMACHCLSSFVFYTHSLFIFILRFYLQSLSYKCAYFQYEKRLELGYGQVPRLYRSFFSVLLLSVCNFQLCIDHLIYSPWI